MCSAPVDNTEHRLSFTPGIRSIPPIGKPFVLKTVGCNENIILSSRKLHNQRYLNFLFVKYTSFPAKESLTFKIKAIHPNHKVRLADTAELTDEISVDPICLHALCFFYRPLLLGLAGAQRSRLDLGWDNKVTVR